MIRQLFTVLDAEHRRAFGWMLAGIVTSALLQGVAFALLVPLLAALFGDTPATAWPWLAALTAVVAVSAVAHYASKTAGFTSGVGLISTLEHRIGDQVVRLPLGWFSAERVGEIGQLTSRGVVDLAGIPVHLLRPVVNGFLVPATVVATMFLFDWRMALAALVTTPLLVVTYHWTNRVVQRTDGARQAAVSEANSRVVEFAQTQPVLRAFGHVTGTYRPLGDALTAQRDATRRVMLAALPGFVSFAVAVQAAFTVLLLLGTYLALGGSLGTAELLALLVLAARFVEPMLMAADLAASLRIARNSLHRIGEVLAEPALPEPATPQTPAGDDLELDGVSFAYDDRPVLSGASLHVPARTMTALVGPSGSGKTTVTRLIARFYDVDAGAVRIGGVDVRELTTEALMARVSLVFQDVYLLDGTIAENIRIGRPEATDEQVLEAARLARVDEIIRRLPQGLDTRVGEAGARLSGGERQRVSIARAILKDAPIVLLDEATASLDPENEALVQDAISALTADRTLLVIAHRLQTVMAADQIVVLDDGQVTEAGRHAELLDAGGRYATFWEQRRRAQGWRLTGQRSRVTG